MPKPIGGDPGHAVYASAFNLVSVLAEALTALPEFGGFADVIEAAQEDYMPSWPPTSPISSSHFNTWAMFDLALGKDREALGTCILALAPDLGIAGPAAGLINTLARSRLGLYVHAGYASKEACGLRELATGERFRTVCRSGHVGKPGELLLVRLVPLPIPGLGHYVAFSSPYVIALPGEPEWSAFFARTCRSGVGLLTVIFS